MERMPQPASLAPDTGVDLAPALATPASSGTGRLAWLGLAGAMALGAVLLVATVAKALDPQALADHLAAQGLTAGLPPMAAALLALVLEGGLGLALLLGVRRPPVLAAAGVLVAFFLALNARTWWMAAHGGPVEASCGCFGNLVQRTPAAAFWQDLLLLVPPLLLAFVGRPRGAARRDFRLAAAGAGAAAFALFAWRAPELPLDDVATRLRPGVELAELCVEGDSPLCLADLAPELREGRWQVVLVDVQGAPETWAPELNRLAETASTPLLALTASPGEQVAAFTWEWGPSYALREAPAPLLRPLYRRLPRSFVSEDGRVVATSAGLPAAEPERAARRLAHEGDPAR
jgi:uncharacterized membrane protein YphA (DoxX/SURF4 family)